jgi:hypothetical protein
MALDTCPVCRGTGRCLTCGGLGAFGPSVEDRRLCHVCRCSGKCPDCGEESAPNTPPLGVVSRGLSSSIPPGSQPMDVVELSKSEFDKLAMEPSGMWLRKNEWAWLANKSGRRAGVVVLDPRTGRWGYNVCERGDDEKFRRVTFADDVSDCLSAKRKLVAAMQRLQ